MELIFLICVFSVYPAYFAHISSSNSFVTWTYFSDTDKAVKALDGRFFAGRQVRAQPYEQELFDLNDLSG